MTSAPTRFAAYVDQFAAEGIELPLVHSSRCENFPLIAAKDSLEPQHCDVFNERLLYFFYGRPVYRSDRVGLRPSGEVTHCPVCFVFRPGSISHLSRVYPCDSGGIARKKFDPPIPPAELPNFALTRTLDSMRSLTKHFFETNERYYWGKARSHISIPASEIEAAKYYTLITTVSDSDYDQRRSAGELQTTDRVSLVNNLQFVILPTSFLEDARVAEAILTRWRCFPITYNTAVGGIPRDYSQVIQDRLSELLKSGGFL